MVRRLSKYLNTRETKRQRIICVAFLWLFATMVFLALYMLSRSLGQGIPCPLLLVTGLYCPGCGTFRAIDAGIRLNFWQAFRFNALTVFLLPIVFVLLVMQTIRYINGVKSRSSGRLELIFSIIIIIISAVYFVLRNIPLFEILRPTTLV